MNIKIRIKITMNNNLQNNFLEILGNEDYNQVLNFLDTNPAAVNVRFD